jgi:hypothetical protein
MNKWIKCKDKLPNFEEEVIYFKDGFMDIGILKQIDVNGPAFGPAESDNIYEYDVSHWRELPEVPRDVS